MIDEKEQKRLIEINKRLEDAVNQYCKIAHAEYCSDVTFLMKLVERLKEPKQEQ